MTATVPGTKRFATANAERRPALVDSMDGSARMKAARTRARPPAAFAMVQAKRCSLDLPPSCDVPAEDADVEQIHLDWLTVLRQPLA